MRYAIAIKDFFEAIVKFVRGEEPEVMTVVEVYRANEALGMSLLAVSSCYLVLILITTFFGALFMFDRWAVFVVVMGISVASVLLWFPAALYLLERMTDEGV